MLLFTVGEVILFVTLKYSDVVDLLEQLLFKTQIGKAVAAAEVVRPRLSDRYGTISGYDRGDTKAVDPVRPRANSRKGQQQR